MFVERGGRALDVDASDVEHALEVFRPDRLVTGGHRCPIGGDVRATAAFSKSPPSGDGEALPVALEGDGRALRPPAPTGKARWGCPRHRTPPRRMMSVIIMPHPRSIGERAANGVVKSVGGLVPSVGAWCRFVPILPVAAFGSKRGKPRFYRHFRRASASAEFAQRMRVERMARSGCACRRGRRPLSQIRAARPAPMAPEGAHNSWRHRLRPTGLQAIY